MMFGTPPGRVPDETQTGGLTPNNRDITALEHDFDMHIHHSQITAISNNRSRPYSSDPGYDFEVYREPLIGTSSAADPSEGPKDPLS